MRERVLRSVDLWITGWVKSRAFLLRRCARFPSPSERRARNHTRTHKFKPLSRYKSLRSLGYISHICRPRPRAVSLPWRQIVPEKCRRQTGTAQGKNHTVWVVRFEKGCVQCFPRVPQAIGLYCSCLSEGNFLKTFYKTFSQPVL